MKTKRIRIGIYAAIVAMALTGSNQAAVQIVDHRPDVYGSDLRTNRGRIAVKSTNQPVISVGTFSSPARYEITEDLSSWNVRSGGWVTGGASSADLTVDSSDNYHFVYGEGGTAPPTYVPASGSPRVGLTSNKWAPGAGSVQIVANDDGISVGYHPRTPEWQSEYWSYTSTDGGATFPATPTVVDHLSNNLSPRFLASADKHYYYSLPVGGYPDPGPFWQQADDANDIDVQSLFTGASPGTKSGSGYYYDFYLAPAWNGSEMNLASIEGPGTGEVSLYLDLEGTPSQVSVYSGTDAESVALATLNGQNYVFFVALDPGTEPNNIDTEVFVQLVDQDGTLIGPAQNLTNDLYQQYELDVAVGAGQNSIHLVFNTNLVGGWADAGERVSYMEVVPADPFGTCAGVMAGGYEIIADLTGDCYVLLDDFAIFASLFLDCIDPTDNSCDTPWAP